MVRDTLSRSTDRSQYAILAMLVYLAPMYRLVLVAAVATAACNPTDNNRPATLEYITEAILQPSCGQSVCHSTYKMESGYAFDTVEAARRSIKESSLVQESDSASSLLYNVLIREVKRMPYDAPLLDKDVALIKQWIDDGAPGLDEVTP
ncbi:MAG: hypothetical protein H7138_01205 [Myxococcales bacterium]|nr:hypothetical protein [Myxococcales bacterium]